MRTQVHHPALNTKATVITTRLKSQPSNIMGTERQQPAKRTCCMAFCPVPVAAAVNSRARNWMLTQDSLSHVPRSRVFGFFDASHLFICDEIAKLRWSLRLPKIPRNTWMMNRAHSRTHSTMQLGKSKLVKFCSWPCSCLPNLADQCPRLNAMLKTLPVSKRLRPPKSDAAFAPRCAEVGRPEESAEAGRAQACLSRIINPALELTVLCTRPCRQASQPPCRCACAFRTTSKRACTKTQMLTPLTASPASQAMAKAYRLPHRLVFLVGDADTVLATRLFHNPAS